MKMLRFPIDENLMHLVKILPEQPESVQWRQMNVRQLKEQPNLFLSLAKTYRKAIGARQMSYKLKSNMDFMSQLVQYAPEAIQYASASVRGNEQIMSKVVQRLPKMVRVLPEKEKYSLKMAKTLVSVNAACINEFPPQVRFKKALMDLVKDNDQKLYQEVLEQAKKEAQSAKRESIKSGDVPKKTRAERISEKMEHFAQLVYESCNALRRIEQGVQKVEKQEHQGWIKKVQKQFNAVEGLEKSLKKMEMSFKSKQPDGSLFGRNTHTLLSVVNYHKKWFEQYVEQKGIKGYLDDQNQDPNTKSKHPRM